MFGFLFDIASAIIGAVLPMYQTWKVVRSRRTTQLVPLAKYWTVFGLFTLVEATANMLYIPYFFPGYSFLKFCSILYMTTIGYQQIYDHVVSPFLLENEPITLRLFNGAIRVGGQLVRRIVREAINCAYLSCNVNGGNVTAANAAIERRYSEQAFEIQEEEIHFFESTDVKPQLDLQHNNSSVADDEVQILPLPRRRRGGRKSKK